MAKVFGEVVELVMATTVSTIGPDESVTHK